MWRLPFLRRTRPLARPRLLVVTHSYEGALEVADAFEESGFSAVFVPAAEIAKAETLDPAPVATVVLPEVSTEDKQAVCEFLRASQLYRDQPIVAVMTLAEGGISLPVDGIVRPPSRLSEALAQIKQVTGRTT